MFIDVQVQAVVLEDATRVLHVGPPSAKVLPLQRLLLPKRQPVVFRVRMTDAERRKFLSCVRQLVGCRYDIVRYVLWFFVVVVEAWQPQVNQSVSSWCHP